jgi:hypothetical protein
MWAVPAFPVGVFMKILKPAHSGADTRQREPHPGFRRAGTARAVARHDPSMAQGLADFAVLPDKAMMFSG